MENRQLACFRAVLVFLLLLVSSYSFSGNYYVKLNGSGTKDGSSWANAMDRENFSLKLLYGTVSGDVFHLAAGNYNPWHNLAGQGNVSNTTKTFLIKDGVSIIGGYDADPFAGAMSDNDYSKVILSGVFANGIQPTTVVTVAAGALNTSIKAVSITGGRGGLYGGGVFVNSNAKVNLSYVHIKNNQAASRGGAIYVDAGAEVRIASSVIEANTSNDRGGGINVYKATAYLDDVKMLSNRATTWGGGMHIEEASCYIDKSHFESNKADHGGAIHNTRATFVKIDNTVMTSNTTTNHGGAIDSYYYSTMALTTVKFINNTSGTWGGAVHNDQYSKCTMDYCSFEGNVAATNGGGFHNTVSEATISNTLFYQNKATINEGGAIDSYSSSKLTLNKVDFKENTAGTWGGAIHNDNSTLNATSCKFIKNKAVHGGGFHNSHSGAYATISQSIFTENEGVDGGAITNYNRVLTLVDCDIYNNTATGIGGAGIHNEAGDLYVYSCLIRDNKTTGSVSYGGGIFCQTGKQYIANSTITSNTSAYRGGAIYCMGTSNIISSTIINNTATSAGGGLYNAGTTILRNNIISANNTNLSGLAYSSNSKYNIIDRKFYLAGTTSGTVSMVFDVATDLGPLQNNGGITSTYGFTGTNNIAKVGGDPSVTHDTDVNLYADQRGEVRTIPVSIGAFEYSDPTKLLKATNDTVQVFINKSLVINELSNDDIPSIANCGTLHITITQAPSVAGAVASLGTDRITYTPKVNFVGLDSVSYELECSANLGVKSTAKIYIKVMPMPDNISDAECVIDAPATTWGINFHKASQHNVHILAQPFVGDVDGDGKPNVVTTNHITNAAVTGSGYVRSDSIIVLDHDLNLKKAFPIPLSTAQTVTPIVLVRLKPTDTKALIVVATGLTVDALTSVGDHKLRAYTWDGTLVWTSETSIYDHTITVPHSVALVAGDINNDGIPEILAGDRIFNGANGKLLLTLPAGGRGLRTLNGGPGSTGNMTYMPMLADLNGDGKLEVVAGNTVYFVDITNAAGITGNTVTKVSTPQLDGFVSVADINLDGKPDVVVTSTDGVNLKMYVWEGTSSNLIGDVVSIPVRGGSRAFIGNIDSDPYPEIAFTYIFGIQAFKYNKGLNKFESKWTEPTTDGSGATTLSMFDFNQDGVNELVYRDEKKLRIINGADGKDRVNFDCFSATHSEYPVIVDFDGDGHADILVSGAASISESGIGTAAIDMKVKIRWYRSPDDNWAPAREVWNQHGYNAVNVNNDLTIPKYQLNPATVFPGYDGILGTADDVRPFNGFLQQQTMLNKDGNPLWLAPNAELNISTPPTYSYHGDGDSLLVSVIIDNVGDAALKAPVAITIYQDVVDVSSNKLTHLHPSPINPGTSTTVRFTIHNFKSSWLVNPDEYTQLILKINDKGNAADDQPVCKNSNTSYVKVLSSTLFAINDNAQLFANIPTTINQLANDNIPGDCGSLTVTIKTAPTVSGATAVINSDNTILYTPATDFTGIDSVFYQLECSNSLGVKSVAKIYITVVPKPDNIVEAECIGEVPASVWGINTTPKKLGGDLRYYSPVFAGDLDGDNLPELVAFSGDADHNYLCPHAWTSLAVRIYMGKDGSVKTINKQVNLSGGSIAMGRVRLDNGRDTSLIFIASVDGYIYAYSLANLGTPLWTSSDKYLNVSDRTSQTLALADFNNDGFAELYTNNSIFDAATGKLICRGTATDNEGYSVTHVTSAGACQEVSVTTAVDINGDGKLELLAGNQAFQVNITRVNASNISGSISEYSKASLAPVKDGQTQVVDINLDGKPDVVVSQMVGTTLYIYIWDPRTGEIIAQHSRNTGVTGRGMPFIGDIDGDGKPEIVVLTDKMRSYKYDGTTLLKQFWEYGHNDTSYGTGLTLFDFNQDGIYEIVYRDELLLRIIDGSTTTPVNKATIACYSSTLSEYPIVVDVDNDNSAEIVVVGADALSLPFNAYIHIYKPLTGTWAPARKVWNQWNYNAVNVNDDLTIPKVQLNPATVFPGNDGILGTSDDVRPYNGFLQQQTTLNIKGEPLFLLPNAVVDGSPAFDYDVAADSMVITLSVINKGDAAFRAPFKITVYRDEPATKKYTYEYPNVIKAGDTAHITFGIPKFKVNWVPFNNISIRVNDSGTQHNDQQVCDSVDIQYKTGTIIASNDRVFLFANTVSKIPVFANDFVPFACTPAMDLVAGEGPFNGTVAPIAVGATTITYTPTTDFVGLDTFRYRLSCGGTDADTASVYILVNKPLSQQYTACPDAEVIMGFTPIAGVSYTWYNAQTGGSVVAGGSNTNTLNVVKGSAADIHIWWVEPIWNGVKFPRYKVDLFLSSSCGGDLVDCVKEGTLLFKEDFGGNTPGVPYYSSVPLSECSLSYNSEGVVNREGYTLTKRGPSNPYFLWRTGGYLDHTPNYPYLNTDTVGHYLLARLEGYLNGAPQQFYQKELTGLCQGTKLYFSLWALNYNKPSYIADPDVERPQLQFELLDYQNNIVSTYVTGDIANSDWAQYGFSFKVPAGINSLTLRVINNVQSQDNGEMTIALDDIEVRLCTPPVELNITDTAVCSNTKFDIKGSYKDDGTLSENLTYRWEYHAVGATAWTTLRQVDTMIVSPNKLENTLSLDPVSKNHEGYYRLLVSTQGNINQVNCRAASDSVLVKVRYVTEVPDIRVMVCPHPTRSILMTGYLDRLDFETVKWETLSSSTPNFVTGTDVTTGELLTGNLLLGTYAYKYTLTSQCGTTSAKAYVRVLKNEILTTTRDTVAVCKDVFMSEHIHLNQILGLEVNGVWKYNNPVNHDNTVHDNVEAMVAPSKYAGALIFNGKKAWTDASHSSYNINYHGDSAAKHFKFRHTSSSDCGGVQVREFVIVVTEKIVP